MTVNTNLNRRPTLLRFAIGSVIILAFTTLLWIQPLFLDLSLPRHDHITHLRWSSQFYSALTEGWLLPRWAYASHGGLGDPTFIYYQPLFYYITGALSFVGLSPEKALIWAGWLPYVVIGGIVFAIVLRHFSVQRALIGTVLVVACPALFFLSTQHGSFTWVLAIPFSILFALESIKDRPSLARSAVWLALVCLSHVLSALMIILCTGFARLVFAFPSRKTLYGNVTWSAAVCLGLALVAFYLYPAVTLQGFITPTGWTQDQTFDWRRAFALPLVTYLQYGFRWPFIQWPLPIITIAMCWATFITTRKSTDGSDRGALSQHMVVARRLAFVALAAIVLSSELAYPLYALLPPLQKLQWPYRFVFIALVLANLAFLLAILATEHISKKATLWKFFVGAIVAMELALCAQLQYTLVKVGQPEPSLSSVMKGEFGQPEYLPSIRGKYWADYNKAGQFLGECERSGVQCRSIKKGTHSFSATIQSSRSESIRLPVFAFPGWSISVNGEPRPLITDTDTGLALVSLPSGQHEVKMIWTGFTADKAGRLISAIAILVLLLGPFATRFASALFRPSGPTINTLTKMS